MSNGGFGGLHKKLAAALSVLSSRSMTNSKKIVTLAITGASGAPYAWRLLECLIAADRDIFLLVSKAACLVSATEVGMTLPEDPRDHERLSDRTLWRTRGADTGLWS